MTTEKPTPDHDLLIILTTKVDGLSAKLDNMQNGVTQQLANHEQRINAIEKIVDQVDALNTYKDFLGLKQEVRDWKTSANAFRLIGGVIGGGVVFLLTQLPNVLKSFGIIK